MRKGSGGFIIFLILILAGLGVWLWQQHPSPGGITRSSTIGECPGGTVGVTLQLEPVPRTLPDGQQRAYRLILENPLRGETSVSLHLTTLHPDVSKLSMLSQTRGVEAHGSTLDVRLSLPSAVPGTSCTPGRKTLLIGLTGRLPALLPRMEDTLQIGMCYTVDERVSVSVCAAPVDTPYDPTGSLCTPGTSRMLTAQRAPLQLARVEDLIITPTQAGTKASFRLVFTNPLRGQPSIMQDSRGMRAACTPGEGEERIPQAIMLEGMLSTTPITCQPRLTLSREAEQTEQGIIGEEYSTSCTAELPVRIDTPTQLVLSLRYAYAYTPPIQEYPFTIIR